MTAYAIATPGQRTRNVPAHRVVAPAQRAVAMDSRVKAARPASVRQTGEVRSSGGRRHVYAIQTPAARVRRIALVLLVLGVLAIFAPRAFAGDEQGPAVVFDTYTVAQGESLWSIASALTVPGDDVQQTVSTLQTLNTMNGSALRAGDQLVIPALER